MATVAIYDPERVVHTFVDGRLQTETPAHARDRGVLDPRYRLKVGGNAYVYLDPDEVLTIVRRFRPITRLTSPRPTARVALDPVAYARLLRYGRMPLAWKLAVGTRVTLREHDPDDGGYTGRFAQAEVIGRDAARDSAGAFRYTVQVLRTDDAVVGADTAEPGHAWLVS